MAFMGAPLPASAYLPPIWAEQAWEKDQKVGKRGGQLEQEN
jgi:hypothetical protein